MSARIDGQVLSALGPSFPPLPGKPKKPSSLEFFLLKQTAFSSSPGPSYTSPQGFLIVHLLVVPPKCQPGSYLRSVAPYFPAWLPDSSSPCSLSKVPAWLPTKTLCPRLMGTCPVQNLHVHTSS